jgi:DNA-directed RNA polymerase specialized sigma24 family protein
MVYTSTVKEFYDANRGEVVAFVKSLHVHDPADIEDITQTFYGELQPALDKWRGTSTFSWYICRILSKIVSRHIEDTKQIIPPTTTQDDVHQIETFLYVSDLVRHCQTQGRYKTADVLHEIYNRLCDTTQSTSLLRTYNRCVNDFLMSDKTCMMFI